MNIDRETYNKSIKKKVGDGYGPVTEGGPATRTFNDIKSIVIHTTNGQRGSSFTSEASFLCSTSEVSAHYIVGKAGEIAQVVNDEFIAWHAGAVTNADYDNYHSIGIENHMTPGEVWTDEEHAALSFLVADLLTRYPSIYKIVTHRSIAIFPLNYKIVNLRGKLGRKIDPSGWDDASFNVWANHLLQTRSTQALNPIPPPPPSAPLPVDKKVYVPASGFVGTPSVTKDQAANYITARNDHCQYSVTQVKDIVQTYIDACASVGLDWWLVMCQSLHETGRYTSWWCGIPRRNFAGLGVTGETSATPQDPATWFYDPERKLWAKGLRFDSLTPEENKSCAVWAHVGHLLSYIYTDAEMNPQQLALSEMSPRKKNIPLTYRGCAKSIRGLTQRWAVSKVLPPEPLQYHNRILAIANAV